MISKEQNFLTARVIAQYRGKYRVAHAQNEYWAEMTGKMMYNAGSGGDHPVVGDLVNISSHEQDQAMIHEILPRRTVLQRKAPGKNEQQIIAANIDAAFIIQAVDRDFNLNRFDRYLTIIYDGNIEPLLVLNKTDLISAAEREEKVAQVKERYRDIDIITTSTVNKDGLAGLAGSLKKDKIYCLVGSSGVGKSSLINQLLGKDLLKTKEISISTHKGKHATTHRELFTLENGAMVIDTPGIRELGIAAAESGMESVFDEVHALAKKCKYTDCTHEQEPGCAVLAALSAGAFSKSKYLNYVKLKKEAAYYQMTALEKRKKIIRSAKWSRIP